MRKTFGNTTQLARAPAGTRPKQFFNSPFPVLNHPCRAKDMATDTVYADIPANDNGATMAQLYCGTTSTVTDVYDMKSEKQFVNTLKDNICERGAMQRLLSDRAEVEMSKRVRISLALFLLVNAGYVGLTQLKILRTV